MPMKKILYNVTVKIESAVHDDWLEWMKHHHIPDVLKTGCFSGCRMMKLISEPDHDDPTYSIQYTCNSITDYETYIDRFSEKLREEAGKRYEGKFVAFRTVLEWVDEFAP
jgi:hypothetical protein